MAKFYSWKDDDGVTHYTDDYFETPNGGIKNGCFVNIIIICVVICVIGFIHEFIFPQAPKKNYVKPDGARVDFYKEPTSDSEYLAFGVEFMIVAGVCVYLYKIQH